ncbi:MAG TPA: fumarylacetoacetate hydrolase family protein [Mycobacteriales bacterium]|nr:fumarylacetoacetate hydrolase family protein [Mycobacteriales bacterium]
MKIARFAVGSGGFGYGLVEGEPGAETVAALHAHPLVEPVRLTGERFALSEVNLGAPVVPSKIVCVGKNYADHVAEMAGAEGAAIPAAPLLFLKPSTSIVGPDAAIVLPPDSKRVDYEGELAVVMGKITRRVTRANALASVFGYTCANDVTARDHQQADGQWTRGKGHDTFCPLGPWIETELDPGLTRLTTKLDGRTVQDAPTSELIHDVASVLAYISNVMTLLPGDVVLTGTPAGVGALAPGQVVAVTVEAIGTLANPVVAA